MFVALLLLLREAGGVSAAKAKQSPVGVTRDAPWTALVRLDQHGAGFVEEMLYRGFVFYYLATFMKVSN